MDEEMSFPNPVVRTDLPVKKRIWPKVVVALVLTVILSVVFLPQILNNRIGRRIFRAQLEGKLHSDMAIGGMHCSWFGGTTATQVWIKSADGRSIGFNSLKCDMSLSQMLRGKYALGNCEVDGLVIDYVLDIGDDNHHDTYELMTGAVPRGPNSPPSALSTLSGNIKLTNAQLSLSRQFTDPVKLVQGSQTIRFVGLDGEFKIPSLDQPWTYKLEGTTGTTGEERGDNCKSSGTICLGKDGLLTPANISVDATFDGNDVPTNLAAVFLPMISADDARTGFGNSFDRVKATLKGTGGVLQLNIIEAASSIAQVHLQPTIDLNTQPSTLKIFSKSPEENQITAAFPTSRGPVRRGLTCINPFAASAVSGTVVLKIESLEMSVSRTWEKGSAKATLDFHDLAMPAKYDIPSSELPKDFAAQIALITGRTDAGEIILQASHRFTMELGEIALTPTDFTFSGTPMSVTGTSYTSFTEGKSMALKLKVACPILAGSASATIPVVGKPDRPMLNLDAAKSDLPIDTARVLRETRDKHLASLRAKL